jgi:hypothetical protein
MRPLPLYIVWAAIASAADAAAAPPRCLPDLPPAAIHVGPPSGWTPYVARAMQLQSVTLLEGPPAETAVLKRDASRAVQGGRVDIWRNLGGAEPKWLSCNYGMASEVMLARPLAPETRSCRVTYRRRPRGGQDIDIACD